MNPADSIAADAHRRRPRGRPPTRMRHGLALIVAVVAGCAGPAPKDDIPSLTTIASPQPEREARRIIPPSPVSAQGIASFQGIDLPLNRPTDDAWALVDEQAVPALTRGVWNANGLRVGLLKVADVEAFIRTLPPALGVSRSQLIASDIPSPIIRTPRLTGVATVDLTIPPMSVHEVDITGGRLQLLARLTHDRAGFLVLDLIPHHHVPRLTLEPRTATQKQLDGRRFDELTLRVHIPRGRLLVLGLYRPWPQPAEPAEPAPGDDAADVADDGARAASAADASADESSAESGASRPARPTPGPPSTTAPPTESTDPAADATEEPASSEAHPLPPPPLPNHLGRAFLTARRLSQPLQTVMLIAVEPLPSPGPTYAPPPAADTENSGDSNPAASGE